MLRFSLRLWIIMIVWAGSLLGFFMQRDPWVLDQTIYTQQDLEKILPQGWEKSGGRYSIYYTPDGARRFNELSVPGESLMLVIQDLKTNAILYHIKVSDRVPMGFVDNDTFFFEKESQYTFLNRRFPEYWWGLFYRPIFWFSLVLCIGVFHEFRKNIRRTLKT